MAVNRFNTPQEAQHQQTYVSQYVAAPFEQFAAQNQAKQKVWDTSESDTRDVLATAANAIDYESKAKDEYIKSKYTDPVNEIVESSKGDYGNIASKVARLKSKIATDQGLAQFAENLKRKEEYEEKIKADPNMNAADKEHALNQSRYNFTSMGGSIAGADFSGAAAYDSNYAAKMAAEHAKQVKPRIIEEEFGGFTNGTIDPTGNFVGYDATGRKVTINAAGVIAKKVYDVLRSDPTVTSNIQQSVLNTRYLFMKQNPNATNDDFNNYVAKETDARLRSIANSQGNLQEQGDISTSTKTSIHGLPKSPTTGKTITDKPAMEIGIGDINKIDVETPFTETAAKEENTGAGIKTEMHDMLTNIDKTNMHVQGTARAIVRATLGKSKDAPISDADWNTFSAKLASGDATTINRLKTTRLTGDVVTYLQKAAKVLENNKKSVSFQKQLYTEQALRDLTPAEQAKWRRGDADMDKKVTDKINAIHKQDAEEASVVNEITSPIIGGTEVNDSYGGKTTVGGTNIVETIADNSGIMNSLFRIIPDKNTGKSISDLLGLSNDPNLSAAQVQDLQRTTLEQGATIGQTPLNAEGTKYNMFITTEDGKQEKVVINIGSGAAAGPNELKIGVNPGSDVIARGQVNYIKRKALSGAALLDGTSLYLSAKGGVTNGRAPYMLYKRGSNGVNQVYTQNVDAFLKAYVNATTDKERKDLEAAYTK